MRRRYPLRAFYRLILFVLLAAPLFAACSPPIGVIKVGMETSYREIHANATAGDVLSVTTKVVLSRYDLSGRFAIDPAAVIAALHDKARDDPRPDLRFAIAELSFFHAKKLAQRPTVNGRPTGAADYFLLSAVYAYDYMFNAVGEAPTNPYDKTFQVAGTLYNRGVAKGFSTGPDGRLEFRKGDRPLPVGRLSIDVEPESLPWPVDEFDEFLPADDYSVYGLSIRNRTPGIGAPLIGMRTIDPVTNRRQMLPVTGFLRIKGKTSNLKEGVHAVLELYSTYDYADVAINGRKYSLETDTTAPLAYRLNDVKLWNQLEYGHFFSAGGDPQLIMIQPYRPGRIPVVFIHGTVSSPLRWAEMWNTLRSDPEIRKHYQFWFFMYNSGLRVSISAAALRDILTSTVKQLDPKKKDPAMMQMVLIGHSQGGLLAKMSVIHTGDSLARAISPVSLDQLKASERIKNEIRRQFFFEPLPFVKRVVFIATPHRGSFRAGSWTRGLMRRLISLPGDILTTNPEVYADLARQLKLPRELRTTSLTSVDAMSPRNPMLIALAKIPVAPGVKVNSIIAVNTAGDPTKGNDGVVEYSSAHLNDAESEFIVRNGHSCQGNPLTIEEVRRILLLHLSSVQPPGQLQGLK